MGCFLACFGSSKRTKHNRKRNACSKPVQASVSLVQDNSKTVLSIASELQDKTEEQLSVSTRKKVTFDSNVKTYEPVLEDEVADFPTERKSEEGGKEEALAKPSQSKSSSSEDSSVTSTGSYPPNHRYQNCLDSDDDEIDYGASDLSDEDDEIREEYNELGEDFGTGFVHVFAEEVECPIPTCESDVKSIRFNPNARDRSVYVHPVLNPVENLAQWKVVKAKRTPTLSPQKENCLGVKELSFSLNSENDTSKKLKQEIPVDASLSNWLVSPETKPVNKAGSVASYAGTPDRSTSQGSHSVISHEDRPILGALTVEELKQFSATSSPRKSPSRSPDEMPIIGTVGTYWNFTGSAEDSGSVSSFKGIPNTTSKYRERNACSKPVQASVSLVQDNSKTVLSIASELQDKTEEQLSVSTRKKVTFDSNVKTYEPVLEDEVADFPSERKSEEGGKEEALAKPSQSKSSSSEDSSVTSTGSYPPNHRYQNCLDSDDDEIDYGASDLSDEDDEIREEYNELGEDFVGDERSRTGSVHVFAEEVECPIPTCESDLKSIGFNPNARDRSVYVHPVLNPVENLTQWKIVKAKRTPTLSPQKENCLGVKELSFSLNSENDTSKKLKQEIPVDASLSNWLVSPETKPVNKAGSVASYAGTPDRSTSQGSHSVISHEDRPILGALTVEELKQFSATSSPRKSPSRSPDEMPIIGTVGTYWNFTGSAEDSGSVSSFKGIPNTTSKYREDKRVNWHATPFETRLEKALKRGAAEATSTYVPRVF